MEHIISFIPNHSQVRIIVPKFPGSLIDSKAIIKLLLSIGFASLNLKIGASLNGKSIYQHNKSLDNGIIVFGNEANGISSGLFKLMDFNLSIPRFQNNNFPESLNLASSVGIILGEIKRKSI